MLVLTDILLGNRLVVRFPFKEPGLHPIRVHIDCNKLTAIQINSFRSNKELVLQNCLITHDTIHQLTPNKNVSLLKMIDVQIQDIPGITTLYRIHPGILTLEVTTTDLRQIWKALQPIGNLKSLKTLVIEANNDIRNHSAASDFSSQTLETLKFPAFNANLYYDWMGIVENNPALKCIDLTIAINGDRLDHKALLKNLRGGMEIKIRGDFALTSAMIRAVKEKATIALKVPRCSVRMTMERFEEILGNQRSVVEFI
jgi:hypothetical protein